MNWITSSLYLVVLISLLGTALIESGTLRKSPTRKRFAQTPEKPVICNPPCPTPGCSSECPHGQYLELSDEGCETCNCYDPCEAVTCEGSECHWTLERNGCGPYGMWRPKTLCITCQGGQEWAYCGSSCTRTCDNPNPAPSSCSRCVQHCECPTDRPIWHEGRCITENQC